jgi:hypothetical protein
VAAGFPGNNKLMFNKYKNSRGGLFGLLELILVLIIILFLAHKGLQTYFAKPVVNQEVNKAAQEAGINTANYQTVISSTKEKFQDILDKRQSDIEAAAGESSR